MNHHFFSTQGHCIFWLQYLIRVDLTGWDAERGMQERATAEKWGMEVEGIGWAEEGLSRNGRRTRGLGGEYNQDTFCMYVCMKLA